MERILSLYYINKVDVAGTNLHSFNKCYHLISADMGLEGRRG